MAAAQSSVWADFVAALNGFERGSALARAFDPAVRVRRFGYHGSRDDVLEEFNGLVELREWLDRTPGTIHFEVRLDTLQLRGQDQWGQDQWAVRYRLTAPEDFVGGGLWIGRLGPDGRIADLEHRPDDLDPKYGAAVPERPGLHHRHDHDHDHS